MSQSPVSLPRTRHVWFAAASLLLGTLAGLLLAEVGLRAREAIAPPSPRPQEQRLPLFVPNPHGSGSFRLRTSARFEVRVGTQDVTLRTNSLGMAWREVSLQAPPGKRRLAFLGDSFAMGCWARDAAHGFVGVVEAQLNPERFEVLNFGVGGYGPEDQALLLDEEVLRFSPSWVVVTLFNGNDFRDAYLGLDKDRLVDGSVELREDVIRERVPPEYWRHSGPVSLPAAERSAWRAALRRSALFRATAPWLRLENLGLQFVPSPQFTQYSFWSRVPVPPVALRARDVALAAVGRMEAALAAAGGRLGIVSLPSWEQVYAVEAAGSDFDIALPQVYVQTYARERGIPYLDLLPILRDHVARSNERLYVVGDTHWNERGHALAGEAIVRWFRCCVRSGRPGVASGGEP